VPIVVVSHRPPPPSVADYPLVTYVADGIASAMAQAKAAAGDRDVLVHGAYTAQRALEAGVLDELQIHQIPVSPRCRRKRQSAPSTTVTGLTSCPGRDSAARIRRIVPPPPGTPGRTARRPGYRAVKDHCWFAPPRLAAWSSLVPAVVEEPGTSTASTLLRLVMT
jgi:hypothetical protein